MLEKIKKVLMIILNIIYAILMAIATMMVMCLVFFWPIIVIGDCLGLQVEGECLEIIWLIALVAFAYFISPRLK